MKDKYPRRIRKKFKRKIKLKFLINRLPLSLHLKKLMSLGKFIEEQLRKAIEAGEFDNLKGAGQPLNLDDYFNTPEDLRMGYSVLKSSKFVPEEVERLKEIGELREKIKTCTSDDEKKNLMKIFNEKSLALSLILERNKTRKSF